MTNEELNTRLYEKMFAEQEQFRDWLLSQPPAEILNHAYEYTVRELSLIHISEGLQNLRDELEQFVQAYRENRELLRFHFHRPQKLLEQLSDLQREPLHFTAAEGYAPQRRFFISRCV